MTHEEDHKNTQVLCRLCFVSQWNCLCNFWRFWGGNSDINWLHSILQRLLLSLPLLSLTVNYNGLGIETWRPSLPTSSLVYYKHAVIQMDCPYQPSFKNWWCMMPTGSKYLAICIFLYRDKNCFKSRKTKLLLLNSDYTLRTVLTASKLSFYQYKK